MNSDIEPIELRRTQIQSKFDASTTQSERNKLGQFATPPALANDILSYAHSLMGSMNIRFLDPALGTGSFYSALMKVFGPARTQEAVGFEIDKRLVKHAIQLWHDYDLKIFNGDFTKSKPPNTEETK